jgi:hypothetical protein
MQPDKRSTVSYTAFEFEEYVIVRAVSEDKRQYDHTIHIGSGNRYYQVSITSSDKDDKDVLRLLESIRLKGRPLYTRTNMAAAQSGRQMKTIDLAQQTTSPKILAALNRPEVPSKVVKFEKVPVTVAQDEPTPKNTDGLVILRRERARYTDAARDSLLQGTVNGRILFKADGTIESIVLDPSLDKGLAKSCAVVARRLKFLPAMINGKPVDRWQRFTCTFDL